MEEGGRVRVAGGSMAIQYQWLCVAGVLQGRLRRPADRIAVPSWPDELRRVPARGRAPCHRIQALPPAMPGGVPRLALVLREDARTGLQPH